jgi:hypothetical protein
MSWTLTGSEYHTVGGGNTACQIGNGGSGPGISASVAGRILLVHYVGDDSAGGNIPSLTDDTNGAYAQIGSAGGNFATWWVLSTGSGNPILSYATAGDARTFCISEWTPPAGTIAAGGSAFSGTTLTQTGSDGLLTSITYTYPAAGVGTGYTQLFDIGLLSGHAVVQYKASGNSAGSNNVGFDGTSTAVVAAAALSISGGGATVARSKGNGLAGDSVLLGGMVARSRWFGRGWRVPAFGGLILPQGI